jgi:hypothetical protein
MKKTLFLIAVALVAFSCKQRTCTCKDINGATYSVSKYYGTKAAEKSECDKNMKNSIGAPNGLTCTLQ